MLFTVLAQLKCGSFVIYTGQFWARRAIPFSLEFVLKNTPIEILDTYLAHKFDLSGKIFTGQKM
jgi:hypothetical protein